MRIAVATDHAGLPAQAADHRLASRALGTRPVDFGTDSTEPVDYPDVIAPAARAVAAGDCELGIVFGGSGSGEQIDGQQGRAASAASRPPSRSRRASGASTTTPT